MTRVFADGDEVRVVDGEFEGAQGRVVGYEDAFGMYLFVITSWYRFPFGRPDDVFGATEDQLELIATSGQLDQDDNEEEEEVPTPPFGLSVDDFTSYVDVLTKRIAAQYDFGPVINSQPGYLRFEESTMEEILNASLGEIEDWIAHGVMAHVRVARILKALDSGGFSQ